MKRAALILAAVGACWSLTPGCAVLTVDVDVYKGPLANESEVQMHQLAVMAIGAKPVLVELRNRLEEAYIQEGRAGRPDALSEQDKTARRNMFRALALAGGGDDRGLAISPASYEFLSIEASRANEILSLYQDQKPDDRQARELVDDVIGGARAYRRAYEVLRGSHHDARRDAVARYGLDKDAPLPENSPLTREEFLKLRGSLRELIAPTISGTGGFVAYEAGIFSVLQGARGRAKREHPERALSGVLSTVDGVQGTDERFEFLANEDAQKQLAEYAALPPAVRQEYAAKAAEVCAAFGQARDALSRIIESCARLSVRVNTVDLGLTPDQRARANEAIAALLSRVVQASGLDRLSSATAADPASDAAKTVEFAKSLDTSPEGFAPSLIGRLTGPDAASGARELLNAHELARTGKGLQNPRTRAHGLAAGPTPDRAIDPADLYSAYVEIMSSISAPFSRGRTPEGLDSLIEVFLNENRENPGADNFSSESRQRLIDSLVQFASKVLFAAGQGEILRLGKDKENSARARVLELLRGFDERNSYYVLQALGNSLLVQANELQARAASEGRESVTFDREFAANGTLFDPSALNAIRAQPGQSRRPTEVIDLLVAMLERQYRDLVTKAGGGTSAQPNIEATRIRQTIDAALAYRAGLVYIRPPSFYLRNSYPVTSLQKGTNSEYRNEVGRHGMKGLPFVGEWWTNEQENNANDPALREEIDKQFWQNINRVKVAGAGKTNYALVKDDVGNWYVKTYSADPGPIIKAAKAAAILAMGDALPLAAQKLKVPATAAETPDQPPSATAPAAKPPTETTAAPSVVQRLVESLRAQHAKGVKEEAQRAVEFADGLKSSIAAAWKPEAGEFTEAPISEAFAAAMGADEKANNPGPLETLRATKEPTSGELINLYVALRRFDDKLRDRTVMDKAGVKMAPEAQAKARDAIRIVCTEPLALRVERLANLIESHTQSMSGVGEALRPVDKKD